MPPHLLADCPLVLLEGPDNESGIAWGAAQATQVQQVCNPRLGLARRFEAARCDVKALKALEEEVKKARP